MRAWEQPKLPVRYHGFTSRDSAFHDTLILDGLANGNRARLHGLVWFDNKSELSFLPRLDRFRRHHGSVVQSPQGHHNRNELAGPKGMVSIGKSCLQLDGAGGAVYSVIDKAQLAGSGDRAVGTIGQTRGADRERVPRIVAADFGQ